MATLEAIADGNDGKAKEEQYTKFLADAIASGDVSACKQFVDHGERWLALLCSPALKSVCSATPSNHCAI
jgi:hypothetical protein